jgi:UDP-glucose 4-epimerase
MKNKTIAVFGGSGFLGTYIVNELISKGYKVWVLDKKYSAYIPTSCFIEIDILNREAIDDFFKKETIDYVYNLAGFANLDKAINYPIESFNLNVMGNLYIIEAAKQQGVKRYIFASSAYAMSNKGSFYGISKLTSEKIVEEYQKRYNLNYTILRFGSVYSERMFENNYIYNLIEKAIKTGKIEHSGDGNEVREYIHAADAAKLAVQIVEDEQYKNKHLMLTGVERLKRTELFEMINEILGNKLKIELNNNGYQNHYKYTPYSFIPQESQRLTPNPYIDMGQGILNCINQIYSTLQND